ncbi:MAG TPA: flavoprotein, partial [Puia sp.]|nr:flavoprotein [Puia sp.]
MTRIWQGDFLLHHYYLANFVSSMSENQKHKIVVAITGASGAIYAKVLLEKLAVMNTQVEKVGVVMSDNAKHIWESEIGDRSFEKFPFTFYQKMDFNAPFAS